MSFYNPSLDFQYSSRYSPYSSALSYSAYPYGTVNHSNIAPPRPHEWTEYQPVERKYIDYVPETKIEYRPVERVAQDYV